MTGRGWANAGRSILPSSCLYAAPASPLSSSQCLPLRGPSIAALFFPAPAFTRPQHRPLSSPQLTALKRPSPAASTVWNARAQRIEARLHRRTPFSPVAILRSLAASLAAFKDDATHQMRPAPGRLLPEAKAPCWHANNVLGTAAPGASANPAKRTHLMGTAHPLTKGTGRRRVYRPNPYCYLYNTHDTAKSLRVGTGEPVRPLTR